ncbi:hypothetical protein RJT34_25282 [Clitoria ternatea]|uniref:Serine-threonine/tyrosine-protein kinase catalytic domain-containing protein n=1 Tax=Clitoria ternatea TaxID=43366 RepID=A0AAN9FPQ9_CLITE
MTSQTRINLDKVDLELFTGGYMAPEYAMHGQFSVKSDVFSFGVLVLEILSGRKNHGIRHEENIEYLLSFAWRNWRNGLATNIIDPILNSGSQSEMMRCIHIGLLCVQENVADRPTMIAVVRMLNGDSITLPIPTEPAFYMENRSGNLQDMQQWEFTSTATQQLNGASQKSVNEVSVTELYPR